jgi:spore maturation protein CgeB
MSTFKANANIKRLLGTMCESNAMPNVLLQELGVQGLPHGLESVSIPTAILDIDTFGWTEFRMRWAMLFDYVFTWHPSYVTRFNQAGHPRVCAIPHAVDERLFSIDKRAEPLYDLGFVGNFGLPQYTKRDRVNSALRSRFRTNDFRKTYTKAETAEIYKHSRVVVNVSRAEFPQEANMRCYEAMAGGALLITEMPTELTEWGFREGEHFIGWRSEDEIPRLVGQLLVDDGRCSAIARAGQQRTLADFTYERCIERIAKFINKDDGRLFAPARTWAPEEVHLLYLSYYYRFRMFPEVLEEFDLLRRANPKAYVKGLPMVLKTLLHALRHSLM